MRNILHELLGKIGYTENIHENDLIKCLRQEAAKWACILGDSDCNSNATFKLKQHLYYDTTEKYNNFNFIITFSYFIVMLKYNI